MAEQYGRDGAWDGSDRWDDPAAARPGPDGTNGSTDDDTPAGSGTPYDRRHEPEESDRTGPRGYPYDVPTWDKTPGAEYDPATEDPGPPPGPPAGAQDRRWDGSPAQRPRRSWRDRVFSQRTSQFAATGAPLGVVPVDHSFGRLTQAAAEFGWSTTDTDEEADAMLSTIPVRLHGYRAGHVVQGRFDPFTDRSAAGLPAGEWRFVAFDAVEDSKLGRTVRQCVTAVPTMVHLPDLRVLPARFPVGPSQGMAVYPTVDPIFDARFRLMAPPGDEALATLGALVDDEVRDALCAGVDVDEFWSHGDWLLATTGGPHDEDALARHLAVLGAMLRALRRDTR